MKKLKLIEKIKIRLQPRYKKIRTSCFGFPITIVDKSSFLHMYNEIIDKEIYAFKNQSDSPNIVDCGANIGISVIFFKQKYPNARVTAFEPDPEIFQILKHNIESGKYKDVNLIQKGLSRNNNSVAFFHQDKSDGGRITERQNDSAVIETVKLSDYLNNKIDFLKIDIEGMEIDVLEECENKLKNVDNIFVEYHSFVDKPQKLDVLLNILTRNGFKYVIHDLGKLSHKPFIENKEYSGMDLQLNIFAKRQ